MLSCNSDKTMQTEGSCSTSSVLTDGSERNKRGILKIRYLEEVSYNKLVCELIMIKLRSN